MQQFNLLPSFQLSVGVSLAITKRICIFFVLASDDFTTMGGSLSQYAASFGNSWKVPDQKNEVTATCDSSGGSINSANS